MDDAVEDIGRNVTGVQGDSADLDDLDRLFDTVKREKGAIDVLWASAGVGKQAKLGEIAEADFHDAFSAPTEFPARLDSPPGRGPTVGS